MNLIIKLSTPSKPGEVKKGGFCLTDEMIDMLSKYVSDAKIPDDCPVFGISRVQISNIVKKYGRVMGVSVHPHTLRHRFAINWVRQNQDVQKLQLVLGHANQNPIQT